MRPGPKRLEDATAQFMLAQAAQERGARAEALSAYADALTLRPEYPEALNNLGNLLRQMGHGTEAEATLRQALAQSPRYAVAHYNLGLLLHEQGRGEEALAAYGAALACDARLEQAAYNCAALLHDLGRLDESVSAYRALLNWAKGHAHAWNNLGQALRERGEAGSAAAAFERALGLAPEDAEIYSNLLFALQHLGQGDGVSLLAAHRGYAARFERGGAPRRHENLPDPERPLRIGLVSADFRAHPLANFIEPLLEAHDRLRYALVCFSNCPLEDGTTARLRAQADRWQVIAGVDDERAAALVEALAIDILVDLSGHTAGNRLGLFLRKPAPLQLTWLGYLGTTGLAAIDYRISDGPADPAGIAEAWHSEALLRLPGSQWCYRPNVDSPAVSPLPAMKNGYLTFGSFNSVAKLSDELLARWQQLLADLPGTRLVVAAAPQGGARQRILDRLARGGVAAERISFRGRASIRDYLALYGEVDIALDSHPYAGGTTTCDALWMGVPVISLAGSRSAARSGASLLAAVGLDDWLADSPREYLGIAAKWLDNIPDLAALRGGLRASIETSPLMDAKAHARDWQALVRAAWRDWCARA